MKLAGWQLPAWAKTMISIRTWLSHARQKIGEKSETAALDTEVLLANFLKKDRGWLPAHPEFELNEEATQKLDEQLTYLEAGYPLPYLLGSWDFYGLPFQVSDAVLIPRPETELIVDESLRWLKSHPNATHAMDVGTGTGCIAVSIAKNHPSIQWLAVDVSQPALHIARKNIEQHGLSDRIDLIQSNLLSATQCQFDLICANPPYIPTPTFVKLPVSLWEPRLALDGGWDGTTTIHKLLEQSVKRLKTPGLLLCEIEETLREPVQADAEHAFPHANISILNDLAGKPRVLRIETT
jgi:release factor glutamine methyltransferase